MKRRDAGCDRHGKHPGGRYHRDNLDTLTRAPIIRTLRLGNPKHSETLLINWTPLFQALVSLCFVTLALLVREDADAYGRVRYGFKM